MFNLSLFLTYVAVVTYTPGPNNIMAMAHASQHGFRKTLPFMFGVITGFVLIFTVTNLFTRLIFETIPLIKPYMALAGAAYMAYLAFKIMKSSYGSEEKTAPELTYFNGLMLQFVNPKFILFALTVSSNFIIPYFTAPHEPFLIVGLLTVMGFSSVVVWGSFGTLFHRFLSRYSKPFNLAMGLLLLYSAWSLSGIKGWF
jgi:threonine/homoserine/homoserine lactone efflux protein